MSARDYKNAGRSRPVFDFAQYRQFGAGLAVGLVVALFVWIHDRSGESQATSDVAEVTGPDEVVDDPVAASQDAGADEAPADYAFFEFLQDFEVQVPDRKQGGKAVQAAQPVTMPGAYILQVGAYHSLASAELQRDKVAKLDIEASILHLSDDTNELHVVRIGPIRDLDRLNAIQKTLHAADIDAFVQRMGD